MMDKLAELESLARAATQPCHCGIVSCPACNADDDLRQAMNPERVLTLLAVVKAAKAMRDKGVNLAQTVVDPGCDGPADPVGDFIELFDGPTQRTFDAALAELEEDEMTVRINEDPALPWEDGAVMPCAIDGCKQPSQMPASEYCRVHGAIGTIPKGGEFAPSPLTLTDADRAEITAALLAYHNTDKGSRDEHIYRAGMAAGIERAITECDREREIYQLGPPGSLRNDAQQMARSACWGCAAAIRALLK